jgi:hypothetical protein
MGNPRGCNAAAYVACAPRGSLLAERKTITSLAETEAQTVYLEMQISKTAHYRRWTVFA